MGVIGGHDGEGDLVSSGEFLRVGFDEGAVVLEEGHAGGEFDGQADFDSLVAEPFAESSCDEDEAGEGDFLGADLLPLIEEFWVVEVDGLSLGDLGSESLVGVLAFEGAFEELEGGWG